MPDLISDTSPIQYLHQLGVLEIFPKLTEQVRVPPAVIDELAEGRAQGVDLPSLEEYAWTTIHAPDSAPALPLVTDLGPGEREVLALALESEDCVAVLDDKVARRLNLQFTGTLGLLLDAKSANLIEAVSHYLDQLDELNFHLAPNTRRLILRRAGETPDG